MNRMKYALRLSIVIFAIINLTDAIFFKGAYFDGLTSSVPKFFLSFVVICDLVYRY